MFEREIQFIYDFNYNKVKKLGSFITYEQLQHSEVHPAILQYISGEIDFLIFEDRQKLLRDSLFDYSGENISNYFSQISEEIKKTKRFSQNYIEKLILHATSFTIHYLSRPNWSMLKFIFDDEKSKSVLEVKQLFNYFHYYPFLKKVMLSYFDKKNMKSISYDELSSLLLKVDGIGLESNYSKVVNDSLDAMADFFNVGMSNRKYIPVSAVNLYLKEKNLTPYISKMGEEFINPEVTRYDISEYKNTFAGIIIEFSEEVDEKKELNDNVEFEEELESQKINNFDTFGHESDVKQDLDEDQEVLEPESEESDSDFENMLTEPDSEETSDTIDEIDDKPDEMQELESEKQIYKDDKIIEDLETPEFIKDDIQELDLAEDQRVDGESLEEGLEFLKEEKELTELIKDDVEVDEEENKQLIDDSDEDDLHFDDEKADEPEAEPILASSLLDKELDDAKALYLEETESDKIDSPLNIIDDLSEEPDNITIDIQDDQFDPVVNESEDTKPSDLLDEAISNLEKAIDEPAKEVTDFQDSAETEMLDNNMPDANAPIEFKENERIATLDNASQADDDISDTETALNKLNDLTEDELLSDDENAEINDETFDESKIEEPEKSEDSENSNIVELQPEREIEEFGSLNDFLKQDGGLSDFSANEVASEESYPETDEKEINLDSLLDDENNIDPEQEIDELKLFEEEEQAEEKIDNSDLQLENVDNLLGTAEQERSYDHEENSQIQDEDINDADSDDPDFNHINEPIEYKQTIEADEATGSIDLTELLENKKMNKIVESVFDYDMEDFANAIEKIAEAHNKDDALLTVEKICETAQVGSTSKEAKLFKSIIADYFDQ